MQVCMQNIFQNRQIKTIADISCSLHTAWRRGFWAICEKYYRTWVIKQAVAGHLPFLPDEVGRHWSSDSEIDVVAIHWTERKLLLDG